MSYLLVVRRYAPFESFGGGFEGDKRTHSSTDPNDTARTIGIVEFSRNSVTPVQSYSSGSAYVGPWGSLRKRKWEIHMGKALVRSTLSDVVIAPASVSFRLHTEGGLPISLLGHQLTPDIDTFVNIKIAFSGNGLDVSGAVYGDGYPNGELFLLDKHQGSALLADYKTTAGVAGPLYKLFGSKAGNKLFDFSKSIAVGSADNIVGR